MLPISGTPFLGKIEAKFEKVHRFKIVDKAKKAKLADESIEVTQ